MRKKSPKLQIIPTKHFLDKAKEERFEFSGLVTLYIHVSNNLDTLEKNVDHQWDIGRATIVYSVDMMNNINLITGWVGSRKKIGIRKKNRVHLKRDEEYDT